MYQTPDTNQNFMVYNDARALIGLAEVTLPNVQYMTSEVKGSGIFGAIDKSVAGQFQAMTATFNWRTITDDGGVAKLMEPGTHHIECIGSVQRTDPGQNGRYVSVQHKLILRCEPKNLTIGKHAVAENHDRQLEMEVVYLREQYDGCDVLEIDKYNSVFMVDGVDYAAGIRAALEM